MTKVAEIFDSFWSHFGKLKKLKHLGQLLGKIGLPFNSNIRSRCMHYYSIVMKLTSQQKQSDHKRKFPFGPMLQYSWPREARDLGYLVSLEASWLSLLYEDLVTIVTENFIACVHKLMPQACLRGWNWEWQSEHLLGNYLGTGHCKY